MKSSVLVPVAFLAVAKLCAEVRVTADMTPPARPLTVWFAAPARSLDRPRVPVSASGTDTPEERAARKIDFLESLPVGNGRLGAMDCGGVDLERVILNESSVWSGGDYDANRHDAYKALPEIRAKLFAGDFKGARRALESGFGWVGKRFDPTQFGCYQTLGDLLLKSDDTTTPATGYRRELDLATGVVTTSFTRNGVRFTRELFVSKPAEVIVLRVKADKPGALDFTASLARPAQAKTSVEGDRFVLGGQLTFDWPGGVGVSYRAKLGVTAKGGSVTATDAGLRVSGADEAVLAVSGGTDMKDADFVKTLDARLAAALAADVVALRDAAAADHRELMERCTLELPETAVSKRPTPERVKAARGGSDPALDALYFQFGRHLLISGSRPDSPLPNNLQGIWAEEIRTPWNGDFHSNINLQMNYWPAEPTGLGDCAAPLFRLIRLTAKKGEATAKSYYDAPGWLCFHTQNPWGFSSPSNLSAGSGSTCGAWLCQHLWSHFEYTGDTAFLREYYPVMRDASRFFLATLVTDRETGHLVTCPSNSPENSYAVRAADGEKIRTSLTYGATYDMQIIRGLFEDTAAAAKILGEDPAFGASLDAARVKLAPTRVGDDGRIMEWIRPYEETEPHHRHSSPIWGLHPGHEISRASPALFEGAKRFLERRGDASNGWSMAWKACFWARLDDGDRAHRLLSMLIAKGSPNLFDQCPPFQIDGNFGGVAAMTEMLLRATPGELRLLPALPSGWKSGTVKGLRAPGRRSVDMSWNDGALVTAVVRGVPGDTFAVVIAGRSRTVTLPAGGGLMVAP